MMGVSCSVSLYSAVALRGPWPGCRRAASFPLVWSLSVRCPRCFAAGLHRDGLPSRDEGFALGAGLRPSGPRSVGCSMSRTIRGASRWLGGFPRCSRSAFPRQADSAPSASMTPVFPGRSPYHHKSSAGQGTDRSTHCLRAALPTCAAGSRGWEMRGSSWGEAPCTAAAGHGLDGAAVVVGVGRRARAGEAQGGARPPGGDEGQRPAGLLLCEGCRTLWSTGGIREDEGSYPPQTTRGRGPKPGENPDPGFRCFAGFAFLSAKSE
ncbi:hypothetical protein QE394_001049 [Arthrobacter sp. SORGH_AS 212]|nr:hypothetical protein [Arthrobacter sp. SORGH_AS_0212]